MENKGKALVTKGKALETEGKTSVDKPIKKISALRAKQISQVLGLGKEGLGDQKGMPW